MIAGSSYIELKRTQKKAPEIHAFFGSDTDQCINLVGQCPFPFGESLVDSNANIGTWQIGKDYKPPGGPLTSNGKLTVSSGGGGDDDDHGHGHG